ncbi:MAG: ribonuclease P protein component [Gammaproteobacteria bacterium]|nr:ribonuclease P protein component [Gammaproteobacteria bacterium]
MMKFSRQSRLLKPAEFKLVFQKPIRSSDDCFRVLARANGIKRHRLGMAVSKKSCSRAVGRNRIKRVIRENFRGQLVGKGADNTMDFVVLSTMVTTTQSNKTLDASLLAHWQRLIRKTENRNYGDRPDQQRIQR